MAAQATERQPEQIPARQNIAGSIGRNTVFGVLANAAQVVTRLITVPIVIHYMGLGGYGIWNIIMMTATYMRFGSVGVKTAFQKYVAEATGDGNYELASKLLSTGTAVLFAFSVVVLIPAATLSHSIARTMGVPGEFLNSAAGALAVLAVIMVMANLGAAYEAIIMGGHRIDLVRTFGTVLTVLEAVAIVAVLRFGAGLLAMAIVMGTSELIYISLCYVVADKVVPQVHVRLRFVTKQVLYELVRFAGSYQLVNLLEVLYASIVPFALLRAFGADSAGVYAVVTRVVSSAALLLDAFLPPILSGGALVYASGAADKMNLLLKKAFKVTLGLSFLPLGFIAVFGTTLAYAWTGESHPQFRVAFWLLCLNGIFRAFSMLALVLYRVSGNVVLDNVRQVLRIAIILVTAVFAHRLGFFGVLAGLAFAELAGMCFMVTALTRTFHLFRMQHLLPDVVRVAVAAAFIFGAGMLASYVPVPFDVAGRTLALLKLVEIGLGCLLMSWPAVYLTGAVTSEETKSFANTFLTKKKPTVEPNCAVGA